MKKIFLIILSVFMIATAICVSAFAVESPAADVVLRISAAKKDGSTIVVDDYKSLEDGWNAAMNLASNPKELNKNEYGRIIVDLYTDWNAVDGEFTDDFFNGKGFNWDAIYFPENVKVTLNLNGHTINRGLTEYQYNGEVMYIDKDADVIINDGTITGGWSCNGAGGIHINNRAYVTLNNVNLIGNTVEDDDGAAIAVYGGATLTMNGGSMSKNVVYSTNLAHTAAMLTDHDSSGVLYAERSEVVLNNVTFKENVSKNVSCPGLVATFVSSKGVLNNCIVEENGYVAEDLGYVSPLSLFASNTTLDLTFQNTVFKNNGDAYRVLNAYPSKLQTSLMSFTTTHYSTSNAYINVENCTFTGNKMDCLFDTAEVYFAMKDSTVIDNHANVAFVYHSENGVYRPGVASTFESCTFNNNHSENTDMTYRGTKNPGTFYFADKYVDVTFIQCDLGDSTFTNKNVAKFTNSSVIGSIFNEGSLVMIISITALVASVAAIGMTIITNKKKKAVDFANEQDD